VGIPEAEWVDARHKLGSFRFSSCCSRRRRYGGCDGGNATGKAVPFGIGDKHWQRNNPTGRRPKTRYGIGLFCHFADHRHRLGFLCGLRRRKQRLFRRTTQTRDNSQLKHDTAAWRRVHVVRLRIRSDLRRAWNRVGRNCPGHIGLSLTGASLRGRTRRELFGRIGRPVSPSHCTSTLGPLAA
jgi:hypothetical protein